MQASGAPLGDAAAKHVTPGYQACTSYPSDRVKPVSTRLPRLVARGCPGAVLGHVVRTTCLRLICPVDKPLLGKRAGAAGPEPEETWVPYGADGGYSGLTGIITLVR